LDQRLSYVVGCQPPGESHRARQPASGLTAELQIQRNTRTSQGMGHSRLHQHGIGVENGLAQLFQVGWACDTHHAPDLEAVSPEPGGIGPGVGAVQLGTAQLRLLTYSEDLIGRLSGKNPEDGNPRGGSYDFPCSDYRDSPRTSSKNNAEIRRAGFSGDRRVSRLHDAAEFDLSDHV